MADLAAVLLIPVSGDLLGLLQEGPCGARPPSVSGALVLAWEGKVSDYGCVWLATKVGWNVKAIQHYVRMTLDRSSINTWRAFQQFGTVIRLDVNGKEVSGG